MSKTNGRLASSVQWSFQSLVAVGGVALMLASCSDDKPKPPDAKPPLPKLVINEIMPSNNLTCADELGEFDDFVELYNADSVEIDLAGFTVTDDPTMPMKAVLPAGLKIAAGGYLVLWFDDSAAQGPTHIPFKLNAAGEEVIIFDAAGNKLDEYEYAMSMADQSYQRFPDGEGPLSLCTKASCGKANGAACLP